MLNRSPCNGSASNKAAISSSVPGSSIHQDVDFQGRKSRPLPLGGRGSRSGADQTYKMSPDFAVGRTRFESNKGYGGNSLIDNDKSWLGDLDSNQGCPVQSREFYR